jgi:hypothetical protein
LARRTFQVVDITEILIHWHAGRSIGEVARSLGVDRNTVRKYIRPAVEAGMTPGGEPVSLPRWGELVHPAGCAGGCAANIGRGADQRIPTSAGCASAPGTAPRADAGTPGRGCPGCRGRARRVGTLAAVRRHLGTGELAFSRCAGPCDLPLVDLAAPAPGPRSGLPLPAASRSAAMKITIYGWSTSEASPQTAQQGG